MMGVSACVLYAISGDRPRRVSLDPPSSLGSGHPQQATPVHPSGPSLLYLLISGTCLYVVAPEDAVVLSR